MPPTRNTFAFVSGSVAVTWSPSFTPSVLASASPSTSDGGIARGERVHRPSDQVRSDSEHALNARRIDALEGAATAAPFAHVYASSTKMNGSAATTSGDLLDGPARRDTPQTCRLQHDDVRVDADHLVAQRLGWNR